MRYLYRFTSRERGSWSRDGSDTWKQMSRERTKQHSNPVLYNALRVGEPPTTAAAITETLQQRGMLEHADNDGHGQHDGRLMNMVLQEHQQPVKADHSLHVLTEPAHTSPPATCSRPPTRPAGFQGGLYVLLAFYFLNYIFSDFSQTNCLNIYWTELYKICTDGRTFATDEQFKVIFSHSETVMV